MLGAFLALEEWSRAKPLRLSTEGREQGGGKIIRSYVSSPAPECKTSLSCQESQFLPQTLKEHLPRAGLSAGQEQLPPDAVSPADLLPIFPSTWLVATPPSKVGLPSADTVILSFKYVQNLLTLLSSLLPSISQPASFSSWSAQPYSHPQSILSMAA